MAWADETLCDYDDVRDRYSNVGDLCESEVENTQNTEITAIILLAKAYIGRKLDVVLETKYAGKSFDASNLKDLILNADTVFTPACVAWTLKLMFEDAVMGDGDFNRLKQSDYEKEFKDEFNTAKALIQFDEDESGTVEDAEKLEGIGANRFYRV